jgi:hypothetical protein
VLNRERGTPKINRRLTTGAPAPIFSNYFGALLKIDYDFPPARVHTFLSNAENNR